jgi:hypothetical protein
LWIHTAVQIEEVRSYTGRISANAHHCTRKGLCTTAVDNPMRLGAAGRDLTQGIKDIPAETNLDIISFSVRPVFSGFATEIS